MYVTRDERKLGEKLGHTLSVGEIITYRVRKAQLSIAFYGIPALTLAGLIAGGVLAPWWLPLSALALLAMAAGLSVAGLLHALHIRRLYRMPLVGYMAEVRHAFSTSDPR